jgi:hypothetical protein
MRIRNVRRKKINYKNFVKRRASVDDCLNSVTEPCKVFDEDGNLMCVYGMLDSDTTELVEELKNVNYQTTTRTGGLLTTSRIFGFQPRLERRQRSFCNQTSLVKDHPKTEKMLRQLASEISGKYLSNAPEVFNNHKEMFSDVLEEWKIPDSLFTSGIINKNNPLNYHFDSGNFENVLSCMLVLRKNMAGGWLCVPEMDTKFLLKHNSLFMFDGQKLLHGVSPMAENGEDAYRFSIVYYSLKGMWKCLTLTEELLRSKKLELDKLK